MIDSVKNIKNNSYIQFGNSSQNIYSIHPKEQEHDEFVKSDNKNKKYSKAKIAAIAGGIIAFGGIVAAAILCKGKTLKPANFSEHIEFTKATTMEDAIAFAKKHLGIEKFELGDDLEMANWVNEGLTNINNRFKGKANMPKNIIWDEKYFKKHPKAAAYCHGHTTIAFNKEFFSEKLIEQVKSEFKTLFPNLNINTGEYNMVFYHGEDNRIKQKLFNYYLKLLKTPNEFTRFDAANASFLFDDFLASIKFSENHPEFWLKKAAKNEKLANLLKENNIDISIENFNKLSKENQKELMKKFYNIVYTNNFVSSGHATCRGNSIFDILYHEMGHLLHNMNTALKDRFWGVLSNKSTNKFINNFEQQEIAGKISWYAQTNQCEFVAECFQAMCAGKNLPDKVMKLYKYYKGPMLPAMETAA